MKHNRLLFEDPEPSITFPRDKGELVKLGENVVTAFCQLNALECPTVTVFPSETWHGLSCAHYRYKEGICINLEMCSQPCTEAQPRNWTWPGNITDREPYGVVCHELGHHIDLLSGKKRKSYSSEYSTELRWFTQEKPITSYCPDDGEWFAEIFRLFLTNPELLRIIRPKTYRCLRERFTPVFSERWDVRLGENVPKKIVKNLKKKGVE